MLVEVLLGMVLLWCFTKMAAWIRKIRLLNKIEAPEGYPIIGNLLEVMVPPEEFMERIIAMCDPSRSMTCLWITKFNPYVILHKASSVETVLKSSKIITKSMDYDFLVPWLGRGLLTSTGSKWFHRRKMLTPAFHFKILEDFVEIFNQKADVLVEKLAEKADGKEFDIFGIVTLCTLDIILETAMGLNIDVQRHADTPYIAAVDRISGLIQIRQKSPWLHSDFLFRLLGSGREHDACVQVLRQQCLSAIQTRRQILLEAKNSGDDQQKMDGTKSAGKNRMPFLDLLLKYSEEGDQCSDEDIREEVDTFLFEGHDTTSSGINMALFLLGAHPHIQDQVYSELCEVVGDSPSITSDHLKELKCLERCIKEALRLYPPVPMFGRVSTDDVTIDGKVIPAGTTLLVFPYKLHRDPAQFSDPDTFNPDRFLPEATAGQHPYAYVPFSAGPRNCIGQKFAMMEEKVVIGSVVRKYKLESLDDIADMPIMGELILRPKKGVRVKMTER